MSELEGRKSLNKREEEIPVSASSLFVCSEDVWKIDLRSRLKA